MKSYISFLFILLALVTFQCKKEEEDPKYKGELEIVVFNSTTQKPVPNANIKLRDCHSSQYIWEQTLIAQGKTGSNGRITFSNLKPMSFSVEADSAGVESIMSTSSCWFSVSDQYKRDTIFK